MSTSKDPNPVTRAKGNTIGGVAIAFAVLLLATTVRLGR